MTTKISTTPKSITSASSILCDQWLGEFKETKTVEKFHEHIHHENCSESALDELRDDDISKHRSSCDKQQINDILHQRLERCDYYILSDHDCVVFVQEELERSCGGMFSCIETKNKKKWAAYKRYDARTKRFNFWMV